MSAATHQDPVRSRYQLCISLGAPFNSLVSALFSSASASGSHSVIVAKSSSSISLRRSLILRTRLIQTRYPAPATTLTTNNITTKSYHKLDPRWMLGQLLRMGETLLPSAAPESPTIHFTASTLTRSGVCGILGHKPQYPVRGHLGSMAKSSGTRLFTSRSLSLFDQRVTLRPTLLDPPLKHVRCAVQHCCARRGLARCPSSQSCSRSHQL